MSRQRRLSRRWRGSLAVLRFSASRQELTVPSLAASARPSDPGYPRAFLLSLILVALAALLVAPTDGVDAHAELVRTEPLTDALLAAPPLELHLWFSEAIDPGAGSLSLRLVDNTGRDQSLSGVGLDPTNPRHVSADVPPLGPGTFTVLWSARAVDGHTLSGTYAFRVGGGSAPGAATVEGEVPRPWAVVTRWLSFLGLTLVVGGCFVGRVVLGGGARLGAKERRHLAMILGLLVALVATVLEPFLQTHWAPEGTVRPDLAEAFAGLPTGWWLRFAAIVVLPLALALAVAPLRYRRLAVSGEWVVLALALTALVGASLTSHAAARETWRGPALLSNVLHQWAVALWIGGLAHMALARLGGRDQDGTSIWAEGTPLRRFSRFALGLAAVAIATGLINTGFLLPALRALWESTYGRILLFKVGALLPVLALATFHRAVLRRAMERAAGALRTTIRMEAALALLVILGGSVLALLAPPVTQADAGMPDRIDLAAPTTGPDEGPLLHLTVTPARSGENALGLSLTNPDRTPLPLDPGSEVRLDFIGLDHDVVRSDIAAEPDGSGRFTVAGLELSVDGWWRVDAHVRLPNQPEREASFFLLLPDPNLNGMEAPNTPEPDPNAVEVFKRGLTQLTGLHRLRYTQRLTDGAGGFVVVEHALNDGHDGETPPASSQTSGQFARIQVGDREWLRLPNGTWSERRASVFVPPSAWGETYAGATGFRLGRVEEIGGEPSQIVTFHVPGTPGQAAAWYAWWVGMESGRLHRQMMVSRSHYMLDHYRDFDATIPIEPPVTKGSSTPPATPEMMD